MVFAPYPIFGRIAEDLWMTPLPPKRKTGSRTSDKVTLKTIAEHLGLTAGTVSAALNNSPAARSIPAHTKNRIIAAAQELNYRPNFFARTLRLKRTYTIGVIAEEIGDAYGAMLISGIEEYLRKNSFFFLTVIHRHDPKLLQTYAQMLLTRGVEGFITLDASVKETLTLPTVAVSGHARVEGVTNVVLDHRRAARLALEHLQELGHQDIAFIKGQTLSSDSAVRWSAICEVAQEMHIQVRPELTIQLEGTDSTPAIGYPFAKQLLARKHPFTALVVGFDDIPGAAYANPGLTTVRQPLIRMGQIAAQAIVDQIEGRAEYVPEIAIEPEFVVRASTSAAPSRKVREESREMSQEAKEKTGQTALQNLQD